ncbi:MAG TPA: hypothetical protein VG324_14135 [Blastocatellia bacterium]|nr:hypothetical protein [Blastocatellia bacterium]
MRATGGLVRQSAADVIDAALGRSKWNVRMRDRIQMAERYASPPQTWFDSREEYRKQQKLLAAALARYAK